MMFTGLLVPDSAVDEVSLHQPGLACARAKRREMGKGILESGEQSRMWIGSGEGGSGCSSTVWILISIPALNSLTRATWVCTSNFRCHRSKLFHSGPWGIILGKGLDISLTRVTLQLAHMLHYIQHMSLGLAVQVQISLGVINPRVSAN